MADTPVRRKKNIEEGGTGVHKRGEGLGTGPVGSQDGYAKRKEGGGGNGGGPVGGGPNRSKGGMGCLSVIVIAVIIIYALFSVIGGSDGSDDSGEYNSTTSFDSSYESTDEQTTYLDTGDNNSQSSQEDSGSDIGSLIGAILSGDTGYFGSGSSEWSETPNTGVLNTEVAAGSRAKRTAIKGDGTDTTTIMVYLCGTDLESKNGMASSDLKEMMAADFGDNINIIVYTGGCKKWQNNVVSSRTNQIYQVKKGGLTLLKDNLGEKPMTDPNTLSGFIKWTREKYPADRYDLIMWDHGGGSISGYGYDEKFAESESMNLQGINTALKDGGVTFDFIGFDACLMATVETALVASNYADYMIASEEVEPGVGWYYTDWLNEYGKNPSMDTLTIGKNIIDTYTAYCSENVWGQKTTLSLIDLAELETTLPTELKEFAVDTSNRISQSAYKEVSNARSETREFASSLKLDQVDLIHLAYNMGTSEGQELADTLKSCVKYNKTSKTMTNAYGLSIYFPYKKTSNVDNIVQIYGNIGMDASYADCIQKFASMEVAGQLAAGGTSSPAGSLSGDAGESSDTISTADLLIELFNVMLSDKSGSISGLDASNTAFFGKGIDVQTMADYVYNNHLDRSNLIWSENEYGDNVIRMSEDQWNMIQNMDVNMFYDDGTGYVDLGLDNAYDLDDDGNPIAPTDRTWMSINGQVVAYYRIDTQSSQGDYAITGRVPCEINGVRANLILVFDSENEDGYVAGACYDYRDGETETAAKNLTELQAGDKIDFLCDFYDYNQNYQDTYHLGETMTLEDSMSDMHIANVSVGDGNAIVTFKFTDIYGQEYWTPAIVL